MTKDQTTKRIRILVAIDSDGKWVSAGCDYGSASDPKEWIFLDDLGTNLTYHWIEADVPVPGETTIEGQIYAE